MREFQRGVNLLPQANDQYMSNTEFDIPMTDITINTQDNRFSPSLVGEVMKSPGLPTIYNQRKLAKNAALEMIHEQCRAGLAKDAMHNAVALTMVGAHLTSMVPSAAPYCRYILEAFVRATSEQMTRF